MKIESKRREFEKQQESERERLHKKYRNIEKEMRLIQGVESSKLDMMKKSRIDLYNRKRM